MKIFFDLDGTLIDSKTRLYKLFQHLVPQSRLTYEEYWNLKQQKISHSIILKEKFKYNSNQFLLFQEEWMQLIEDDDWLKHDQPFVNVKEYLEALKKLDHRLYIVTNRQSKPKAVRQVTAFGWVDLFDEILVTEQKTEKTDLIKQHINSLEECWIIGDTGKDIQTGKQLNINTAAVLTGFLNKEKLIEYKPEKIADSVVQIVF